MKKYIMLAINFLIHTLNNLLLLQGVYRISDKIKEGNYVYIFTAIGFAMLVTIISFIFNEEFKKKSAK